MASGDVVTAPSTTSVAAPAAATTVRWSDYAQFGVVLTVLGVSLSWVSSWVPQTELQPERLLAPMFAMLGVTAGVWLLMVVVRNWAVIRGLTNPEYYLAYARSQPPDWIERPARTFNNLMQVPTLFYVVCILMLSLRVTDQAQLVYAWLFVATRLLHAVIYIGWNFLPYRFAAFVCSCIVLGVLWTRFALQTWALW